MDVKKENVRKDTTSCDFCNRGELNNNHNGLVYPYEEVITFKREGSGLLASKVFKPSKKIQNDEGISDSV